MLIQERFQVAQPVETVYRAITNVGEIGYCLAGVKDVRVINDSESEWKVEARVGAICQVIKLRGRITERAPGERVAFTAEGQHVFLTGDIQTEPNRGETVCSVTLDLTIQGPLAPLVNLIAKTTQRQLMNQTITNFRRKVEGLELIAPPPREHLLSRFFKWIRQRLSRVWAVHGTSRVRTGRPPE